MIFPVKQNNTKALYQLIRVHRAYKASAKAGDRIAERKAAYLNSNPRTDKLARTVRKRILLAAMRQLGHQELAELFGVY